MAGEELRGRFILWLTELILKTQLINLGKSSFKTT